VRLATFNGGSIGRVEATDLVDITELVAQSGSWSQGQVSPMRQLVQRWDELALRAAEHDGRRWALADVCLDAPVPDPSKILAAPVNYSDHKAEMSVSSQVDGLGLFLKSPASLIGSNGVVRLPYTDRRFDQEGELAIVIGGHAHRIEKDPLLRVFGYTALLDITMRGGEDRSTRKSFTSFTPAGPWLVTRDEFGDSESVDLRCTVNGHLQQQANTRDLIWGVAALVEYASWISPLHPGDIISTGTPAGVDQILAGDRICVQLSGMEGELAVSVSDEDAVLSHTSGKDSGPKPPPSSRG